jgi:hypothetical protein
MEDLTLLSVGGSLKKWVYYAPILPKCQEVPHTSKFKKSKSKSKNLRTSRQQWERPATGRQPLVTSRPCTGPILLFLPLHFSSCLPIFPLASPFFPPSSPTFGHFGQLHLIGCSHMPALPRVCLKTSNTHNF